MKLDRLRGDEGKRPMKNIRRKLEAICTDKDAGALVWRKANVAGNRDEVKRRRKERRRAK